ncbi:MAG: glycosyltransferase [Microbacterium sp.]
MPSRPTKTPRVSIIVRTRNRLDLLARAIDDIFAQTFDNVEVIVVDDADDADDGAAFVAALPQGRAERVRLVSRAGQQHGRWLAANSGLEAVRGEFISLHDDDDYWDPEFLARTIDFLDANPGTPAVCSRTTIVIERPNAAGELTQTDAYPFLPELSGISLIDMLRANRIPPISMLYRRSLHDELGPYDSSLRYLGDWAFYLAIVAKHPIGLLEGAPLAFWSLRPESVGDDSNSISAERSRAATDDAIRDAFVRRGIDDHGMALFVHVAHESKWLDHRLTGRIESARGSLAEQSDGLSQQIESLGEQLSAMQAELSALREEVHRRTSVTDILTRPFRGFRARPRA